MPVRLLHSLSVTEKGFSFQDLSLGIGTSKEDNLCNEMSQDGIIVCHTLCDVTLHSYKHYITIFATAGSEYGIGSSPDQFFTVWQKKLVWE